MGQRPLRLSDYGKAVLAIRDGELDAFLNLYPRLLGAHADELFIKAAGRPGAVDVAKLLLDGGMDFGRFRQVYPNSGSEDTIQTLTEHWNELQAQTQEQDSAPKLGGMTLG